MADQRFARASNGLLLPVTKPKPPDKPSRALGALEIGDKLQRDAVKVALHELGKAIGIPDPPRFDPDERAKHKCRVAAYDMLADMLLGPDRPQFEIKT